MNVEAGIKAPWHLWLVGVAALLWYLSGTYTIFMAQANRLPDLGADERLYYAAQPFWFVAVTDIALLSAVVGSVLLLRRNGRAARAFALSLVAILATQIYDLAMGTSRSFANPGAMAVNGLIVLIAALALWYALSMKAKGALR